jgi:hypothetical protein
MALDEKTGHLLFGWYDGRHDPTYQSVHYYGAVFAAKELDKIVKRVPASRTTFTTLSVATFGSPG